MSVWLLAKTVHVTTAVLSISLFVLRGIWMIGDSPMRARRWVKVLPHVIDSLLLASAIVLAVITYQYPLVHAWLTLKVVLLLVYIGLGMLALRFGRSRRVRVTAWLAAIVVFGYIVAVALQRNPWPFAS